MFGTEVVEGFPTRHKKDARQLTLDPLEPGELDR